MASEAAVKSSAAAKGQAEPFAGAAPHREIRLQCPRCEGDVKELTCSRCMFEMTLRDGIVHALPVERVAHYARFGEDYERIRKAEGRGSQSDAFYLALPFKDLSGRNAGQWRIRAQSFRYMVEHLLRTSSAHTSVLDLGAGNCWMSFRLAQLGYRAVAVDLLVNNDDGLGAADHYRGHVSSPISRFRAEAKHLPFGAGAFDYVIFNASFHYAENYEETLREAFRCLRPGGKLIISDTPWYSRQESGEQMMAERQLSFQRRFGTASNSVRSLEFLTDERLDRLEAALGIRWERHSPRYGLKWALRPWVARLRGKREPSRFMIYVASKHE